MTGLDFDLACFLCFARIFKIFLLKEICCSKPKGKNEYLLG